MQNTDSTIKPIIVHTKATPKRYLRDGFALSATNEERMDATVLSKDAKALATEGEDWLRLSLGPVGHSQTPQLKRKFDSLSAIDESSPSKKLATPDRAFTRRFRAEDPQLPKYSKIHQTFLNIPHMPHKISLTEAVLMYRMVNWKDGSSPTKQKSAEALLRLVERTSADDLERALGPTSVRLASQKKIRDEYLKNLKTMYARVHAFCHANPAECTNESTHSPLERKMKAPPDIVLFPLFNR